MNRLFLAATAGAGLWAARRVARARRRIDFHGATVVITGGSRGFGLELARRFAREGARIAILARNEEELERAENELSRTGADVLALVCDVMEPHEVKQAVDTVVAQFGGIDVLVNNAGVIQVGPIEHMRREDYEQAMGVHFWGPYHLTQRVLPIMRRRGVGRIVNISSIAGLVAIPHLVPYVASKFALTGFSNGLRAEVAKDGIRVTTVFPGLMRTGGHVNAYFKGQHEREYAWFSIGNASPLNSIASGKAAELVLEAARYGDPSLLYTTAARLLHLGDALFPHLTAGAMKRVNALLPAPTSSDGDERRRGWDSQSELAPSALTRPSDRAVTPNNENHTAEAPR